MRLSGILCFIFLLTSIFTFAQSKNDTLKLFYEIDKKELTREQVNAIDSVLSKLKTSPSISITGYADYLSGNDYNIALSLNRAKNVKSYLMLKAIKPEQIIKCEGKGELKAKEELPGKGVNEHRRVEIVFTSKKDLEKPKEVAVKNNPVSKPQPISESKTTKTTKIDVGSLKKGETLRLKNLNFLPGRHVLTQKSLPELQNLLQVMQENPTLKIEIHGHICCKGNGDGYDLDTGDSSLSVNRAKYVQDYLISKGIDPDRLSFKGFARTKPLVDPEMSMEDEDMNRRVEIMIIEK